VIRTDPVPKAKESPVRSSEKLITLARKGTLERAAAGSNCLHETTANPGGR